MADSPTPVLCPYCGHLQKKGGGRCEECNGLFEPLSRYATQIAMGPWQVRDPKRPFQPGRSYEVLKKQIAAGRIGPHTVIRGPTTHQFWALARHVPGVSHLVGYCHACDAEVGPEVRRCPSCGQRFREVPQRNELGLQFPTREKAEAAQRALDRKLAETGDSGGNREAPPDPAASERATGQGGDQPRADATPAGAGVPGADLLDQVLESSQPASRAATAQTERASETGQTREAAKGTETEADASPAAAASEPERPAPGAGSQGGLGAGTWLLIVINVLLALAATAYLILRL